MGTIAINNLMPVAVSKVRKDGNSYVVTIPKEALKDLNLVPGDHFKILPFNQGLVLLPDEVMPLSQVQRENYTY